jgi:transposase
MAKHYDSETKEKLIKEAKETGNVAMVARGHQISAHTLYSWIRASAKSKTKGTSARVKELEKKLEDQELENEILRELLKKTNQAWLGGSKSPESSSEKKGRK